MSEIGLVSNTKYSTLGAFSERDNSRENHTAHNSYLKQEMHDKKIDQFFWTDTNAPHKRHSPLALAGAFLGVIIPTLLIGKKQQGIKLNSLKNLWKAINVNYELKEMLATGLGGVVGGLLGGLADRKEKEKLEKLEEASFQAMNICFPAVLVTAAMKLSSKVKMLNNVPSKIILSALSIWGGASLAVKASNKLDDNIFNKYVKEPDRKLKKKDFIVHVDDLVGTLILAKFPLADKLHVNKILPLIFTWSGYHVGDSGSGE